MTDKKFEKIEMVLAHQDRQIQDMSEMINAQWKQIEMLKRRLDMAQSKLSVLESSAGDSSRDKPPHY